jgi:[protein-PII] uridylyltransferase
VSGPEDAAATARRLAPGLSLRLRDYVGEHRPRVESVVREAGPAAGTQAGEALVAMYDGMLSALFAAVRAALEVGGGSREVCLAAVGSYGRGTMALHSDLDVRLLHEGDAAGACAAADALLYPLWDVRVAVGHQVVGTEELVELARADVRTATALLDWRHLGGSRRLSEQVAARAWAGVFSPPSVARFAEQLERLAIERHERFGSSVYLLEPDVKLGAGGSRDLDVALWAARARWKASSFADLARLGVLVRREVAEIVACRDHVARVRNQLHLGAGRRTDRLTFEQQERIAAAFGYGSDASAVERFMSDHYRSAAAVMRAREMLVGRAAELPRTRRATRRDLGGGLELFDDQLTVGSTAGLAAHPSLALRLYAQAVRRDAPIYPEARKAVRGALEDPAFRQGVYDSVEARELLLELCTVVQRTRLRNDSVLGDLHQVGLLTALIPELLPLVGRVHHDVYHVLTADVHSIAAVDKLRELARGELASSHPLACRLAAEIARPRVLFFALLLHDVGKAIGGRDHASRGAAVAREVALRFGLSKPDAAEVSRLVGDHLLLYHVATRRDVDDPEVIERVARKVRDREGLRALYLLTFADVSTTSPQAMTSWKARLLESAFEAVEARLRSDLSAPDARSHGVRERLAALGAQQAGGPDARAFAQAMPQRYLLATSPERVREHVRVVESRAPGTPRVALVSAAADIAELCVVADDRPGLLADIAASLAASRLGVLEAQIFSRARRDGAVEAVDLFFVRAGGGSGEETLRRASAKAERDLGAVLDGRLSSDEIMGARGRALRAEPQSPRVETRVVVDNRASSGLTVVEVLSRDRPGLLYALARTFRDLRMSIRIAKINTEGTSVADVFYVCEADGAKVESPERVEQVRAAVHAAVERLEPEGS